jgi:hypothetical protein
MRFRGTTIRRKIVALLLIPLVSLTALWGFAAFVTSRDVWGVLGIRRTVDNFAHPAESSVLAIQKERRQALVYLADPRESDAMSDLLHRESQTDTALTPLRSQASSTDNRGRLTPGSRRWLDTLVGELDGLRSLRGRVENRQITRLQAYDAYNGMVDPAFDFLDSLSLLNNAELSRPFGALTAVIRATDNISREDALMSAAMTAGRATAPELEQFTYAVGAQRAYYHDNLKQLQTQERSLYTRFWNSDDGRALHAAENAVISAGAGGAPRAADRASWPTVSSTALTELDKITVRARDIQAARTEPSADRKVALAGIAGGAGLVAVVASVIVSVRIGRRLIRDLTWLRREAQDVSRTRLPRMMRRLAAGEDVDVDAEAPRLEYGDDEVGQVGGALNALHRAAVEAAVRQSEMRRGVSEVFVNLARRSQVLLHRQLTLLDTMERRTEDSRELADLFRLDHMTTRMRRHAEGLVILSGAAPSRQWRKPVQLMDVVRAAVAEVEDYERVEVRRLDSVAVVGQAVADLTHLIAELVENATVFSPPHTTVQVHGEQVANGYALEIDDRGLGLTPDAMLDSNQRLAETPEFELSDTDRLGLFVVSRLAQRQGVRVCLKPSPYGGTTAVVLIPAALLTSGESARDTGGSRTGEHRTGNLPRSLDDATRAEDSFRRWGLTADRGQHRELPGGTGSEAAPAADPNPGDPGVLPRWRRTPVLVAENGRSVTEAPRPGASGPGGRVAGSSRPEASDREVSGTEVREAGASRSEAPGSEGRGLPDSGAAPPAAEASRDDVSGAETSGAALSGSEPASGRAGTAAGASAQPSDPPAGGLLPRRVRQASLAPQLRGDAGDESPRSPPHRRDPAERERSPEDVRARMASLQRGWTRGRSANEPEDVQDADGLGDSAPSTTTEGNGP